MKLDFVCIGAQKAGTTTLHDILITHPDIYLPPRKEAQFFDINERFEKGINYYFETFFKTYNGEKFVGNINPNLQMQNRSLERLHNCFGDELKIIFIMRDPVKRAYSHYLMSKKRGYEKLDFFDAMKAENERISNPQTHRGYISEEPGHYEINHWGYVYRSLYANTVEYLFANFPKENIHLMLFEDFIKNKNNGIKELLKFLSIPDSPYISFEVQSNVASEPKSKILRDFIYQQGIFKKIIGKVLSKKNKEYIRIKLTKINNKPLAENEKGLSIKERSKVFTEYFEKDIKKLELLTGLDLNNWKC
jgi:hypothetical protein